VYDFNRDGRVNLVDVGVARVNQTGFSTVNLITAPDGNVNKSGEFASDNTDTKESRSNHSIGFNGELPVSPFDYSPESTLVEALKTRVSRLDNVFANVLRDEQADVLSGSDDLILEFDLDRQEAAFLQVGQTQSRLMTGDFEKDILSDEF
jgi:hypothetical protein